MRIDRLDLIAFGPFTDRVLEFAPNRVELIYGLNGAGKSTALRGLTGLLYGVAVRTTDDHVHEKKALRVGARLSDGTTALEVVRRKTQKDSLDGLDEQKLEELLGGVNEDLFTTMFALNHERLRAGGRQLLEGTGDLAEQLFGAGLGRDIHEVLAGLNENVEEIFTPRARSKQIHKAINEFRDTKRDLRSLILRPEQWAAERQELLEKEAERDQCNDRLLELSTQKATLERYQKTLPRLAKYDDLIKKREALGEVVQLPPEAGQERRDAQRHLAEARSGVERLRKRIADADRERRGLKVPVTLLDRRLQINEIERKLGAHLKAADDLSALKSNERMLKAQARSAVRDMGKGPALDDARELVLPKPRRARIRALATKRQILNERLRSLERGLATERLQLAKVREELAECETPPDTSLLEAALDDARQQGDLVARCASAERDVGRLHTEAEAALQALGLWSGPLHKADRLPLPPQESVARFRKGWDDAAKARTDASRDLARSDKDLLTCIKETEALRREGDVPTVGELDRLRDHRDRGWELVRRTLEGADTAEDAQRFDGNLPLADAYERAVRGVDAASDALRQAADRVVKNEYLLGRQQRLETERRRRLDQSTRQEAADNETQKAWRKLWEPAGIVPLPPAEMRSWLETHSRLLERLTAYNEAKHQLIERRAAEESIKAAMRTALESLGKKAPAADLANLRQHAERVVSDAAEWVHRREALVTQKEARSGALDEAQAERDQLERDLGVWRADWDNATRGLTLGSDAPPEEAESMLERIDELEHILDQQEALGRRSFGIERDAEKFGDKVNSLASECATDLVELRTPLAAEQLIRRFHEGQVERTRRDALDRELAERREELQEFELRERNAGGTLERLVTAARCKNAESLEESEHVSDQARGLDASIEETRRQILELGAGATVDALREQTNDVELDSLPGRIAETQRQLAEVESERSALAEDIGGRKSHLTNMDGGPAAAEAAARGQEQLARVRELARQYARFRLAAYLLEREIEHYRKDNQGPLLKRAEEHFSQLTLGLYERLSVDYDQDGRPHLLAVRDDGAQVRPQVLSDGERDQLYLALRIAGLERHLDSNQPLPFVADDVFVNFDDKRAGAGFKVLGKLSQRTQVLFFTHHSRLRDVAHEALSDGLLALHELP